MTPIEEIREFINRVAPQFLSVQYRYQFYDACMRTLITIQQKALTEDPIMTLVLSTCESLKDEIADRLNYYVISNPHSDPDRFSNHAIELCFDLLRRERGITNAASRTME